MIEKIKQYKILAALLVLALVISIPITIVQLRKQQESRSRAAGEAVSVLLSPLTSTVSSGQILTVDVNINGGTNNISAVDITLAFGTKFFTLQPAECPPPPPEMPVPTGYCQSFYFTPTGIFTTVLNDQSIPGSIHYVGVNPTPNAISGSSVKIGTLKFLTQGNGVETIGFSNIHINASGVQSALPVDTENTKNGTYTITTGEVTSTPGVTTTLPTPTCAPRPACLDTEPRCLPPEPIGGWCPVTSTPSPTIRPTSGPTPTPIPPQVRLLLDLNDDGKVDELDLNILLSGFSRRSGD